MDIDSGVYSTEDILKVINQLDKEITAKLRTIIRFINPSARFIEPEGFEEDNLVVRRGWLPFVFVRVDEEEQQKLIDDEWLTMSDSITLYPDVSFVYQKDGKFRVSLLYTSFIFPESGDIESALSNVIYIANYGKERLLKELMSDRKFNHLTVEMDGKYVILVPRDIQYEFIEELEGELTVYQKREDGDRKGIIFDYTFTMKR